MKVEECLNELEEILEESWNLPLFKGKVFVDVERIRENCDKIRSSLPEEIRQAKAIVSDRAQIISDAKAEADTIIKVAQEKARTIVSQDELVKRAEAEAEAYKMISESLTDKVLSKMYYDHWDGKLPGVITDGNTLLNMVIAILDGVVARIALSLLFGRVLGWGLEGFWFGNAMAAFVSVILGSLYFFFGKWKDRRLLKDPS